MLITMLQVMHDNPIEGQHALATAVLENIAAEARGQGSVKQNNDKLLVALILLHGSGGASA